MNGRTIVYAICCVLALMICVPPQGAEPEQGVSQRSNEFVSKVAPPGTMHSAVVELEDVDTFTAIDLGTYTWTEMNKRFGLYGGNIRVSDPSQNPSSEHPAMVIDSSGFYIVFSYMSGNQHDLAIGKSTDNGATWTVKRIINPRTQNMDEVEPSIAVNETGGLFVSYANASNRKHLPVVFSSDGGNTWTGGRFNLENVGQGKYSFDFIARPSVATASNNSKGDTFAVAVETKEMKQGKANTILTLNNSNFASGGWGLLWWNVPAGADMSNPSTILVKDTANGWIKQYCTFEMKNGSHQDILMFSMYLVDTGHDPEITGWLQGGPTSQDISPSIRNDGNNYLWTFSSNYWGDMDVWAGISSDGHQFKAVNATAQKGVDETHPAAFLSGSNAYVVFFEGNVLKYVSSPDAGATWKTASTVTDANGDAKDAEDNADVYFFNNKAYATWADGRDSGSIYFSELIPRGSISGKVIDKSSTPVAGATVTLKVGGTTQGTTTSNTSGGYIFEGLSAGTYTLDAGKPGYLNGTITVTLGAGEDKTGQDIQLLPPTGNIVGVVKEAGSGPIQGVTITATAGGVTRSATTAVNGSYSLTDLPTDAGGTTYTLTATHPKYATKIETVSLNPGETKTKDFELSLKPGGIIVKIQDSEGKPIKGATVTVTPKNGTPLQPQTTDDNGTATFTGLKPGVYDIRVTASGFKEVLENLTVNPGENATKTITLEKAQGGGDIMLYIILIVVIVVVIAVIVAVMLMRKKKQAQPMPGYAPYGPAGMPPAGYPPQQPGYGPPPEQPPAGYPPQQPGYGPPGQQPPPGY
jgi:hypothetical protein